MGLPLVDLAWQHRQVAAEIEPQLLHMMSTGRFVLGDEVERFEEEYARYCGVRHCIGVASGTDALVLSLRAVGLQPGDEVIVPANSFVASAAAVVLAGGVPVLVDVRDDTLLLDLDAARAAITARTRAIIPVHLFGRLVDMPALAALAADAGLAVIEDAAQAHGARAGSYWPGSTSELVATSFYPAKNLGAYGDAGAVLTNRSDLAERMLLLRDHGSPDKYHHEIVGTNSRLDALQAAVLSVKLAHLDEWNALRREAAGRYASLLAGVPGVAAPPPAGAAEHVWHLYTVRVPRRDRILEALRQASIGAGVHYPVPLHLQPALLPYAGEAARPVAERAASELLSLPIYPGITPAQQELVAATLSRLLRGSLSRQPESAAC